MIKAAVMLVPAVVAAGILVELLKEEYLRLMELGGLARRRGAASGGRK